MPFLDDDSRGKHTPNDRCCSLFRSTDVIGRFHFADDQRRDIESFII